MSSLDEEIFLGGFLMVVGVIWIICVLLSTIILSMKTNNPAILSSFISSLKFKIFLSIIGVLIIMFGYYYKNKNERLLNEYQEKEQVVESEKI